MRSQTLHCAVYVFILYVQRWVKHYFRIGRCSYDTYYKLSSAYQLSSADRHALVGAEVNYRNNPEQVFVF